MARIDRSPGLGRPCQESGQAARTHFFKKSVQSGFGQSMMVRCWNR
jgi:hypothetical protein